jgi:hypothetical protein
MLTNLREQIDALTKKNTELVATGVFSFGGIIAVTLFAWILSIIDKKTTDQ